MWYSLVYNPKWSQSIDFCHFTMLWFCLFHCSFLTWQSNLLSFLHRLSFYIWLLCPRCFWSKTRTEINPQFRRSQMLSFTTLVGSTDILEKGEVLKGASTKWQLSFSHPSSVEGTWITMDCSDKPVIRLCLPPFSFTTYPVGITQYCSVHSQLATMAVCYLLRAYHPLVSNCALLPYY